MTTLLERTKGSALDVVVTHGFSPRTAALLSSHTRRIRHLEFPLNHWADILTFSEVNPGPLPLLRTLKICVAGNPMQHGQPSAAAAPPPPLLVGAIGLEELVFDLQKNSTWAVSLGHFEFPNLTTFKFTTPSAPELNASDLLGFLGASSNLRMVEVEVHGSLVLAGAPFDTPVVLQNVETFSLSGKVDGSRIYYFATHVSCPRAKYTSLALQIYQDIDPVPEIFPDPASWEKIVHQYTTSPVEEVTLDINLDELAVDSLTFQSSDGTIVRLGFQVFGGAVQELDPARLEMAVELLSRAFLTIRDHPQLPCLKRLYVKDQTRLLGGAARLSMVEVVWDLFSRLELLDELTISGCDLQVFLAPFFDLPELRHFLRVFPRVKKVEILDGRMGEWRQGMEAIKNLAKSQYEQEKPFERMTVTGMEFPTGMAETLRQWVGVVHLLVRINGAEWCSTQADDV